MRDGVDEFTLLCERCGYVLEGLDAAGVCPECGKPVAESVPGRRDETPGMWACLRHPRRSLDRMPIDGVGEARRRAFGRCLLAAVIAGLAIVWGGVPWWLRDEGAQWAMINAVLAGALAVLVSPVGAGALFVLAAIESRGLRFFGARRGFRVTPAVSATVCSHGCVGWVAGAVVWLAGWTIVGLGVFEDWFLVVGLLVAVVGAIGGLLAFEVFAYLGLQRCKYANRVREGGDG